MIVSCTGCPQFIRMDRGTENAEVAVYQVAFHLSCDEHAVNKSVIYGISPANFVRFHTQYKYVTVNEERDHSAQNVHSSYKRL